MFFIDEIKLTLIPPQELTFKKSTGLPPSVALIGNLKRKSISATSISLAVSRIYANQIRTGNL